MVMVEKEQHLKMRMEHIRFGKEELERRRKSPVYIPAEHVAAQLKEHYHVYIVDPRLGFNQRTFRFWINYRSLGEEMEYSGKQLGHRHTVEAIIYIHQGHGYSVIDGIKYPWKAGDLICVPVFAWHRHHNESNEDLIYFAATTGPLSMATGIALYEEENYPEYWVFAQRGEEAMKTLIPGGAERPPGGTVELDQTRWKPKGFRSSGAPTAAEIYFDQLNFAQEEERLRRAGKVLVKSEDLDWGLTPMGRVAYGVDPKLGFHVKLLGGLFAEIPPGKRSGAHRHIYEETNYVIAGEGYSIIEDQKYEWKKGDTLVIPVFAWHQHFNSGEEKARFLVITNRPAMESTGYIHTQQGEPADYE
jgi:quercetin dioxygenase-like cupin family protein